MNSAHVFVETNFLFGIFQMPMKSPCRRTRYFHRDLLLLDFWGDRQFHRIDFVVNDENAPIAVLIIVYVEHQ